VTNTWSKKPGLPEPRRRGGAAAVLVGNKIYVSHGNRGGHETGNYSTSLPWLDYYDTVEDRWYTNLPDAPHVRDHVGGALVNGRICVAGGRDGGDIDFFRKVILPTDCYDPLTNTWAVEADIPEGRAGSSYGRTCDGKLMVAGGEGGSKTTQKQAWANVDVFDGTSWSSIASLNIARHGSGLSVECACNQIYIASGARTQGGMNEITSVETLFLNGVDVPCIYSP
jgi:N-acetylneuraminic acid mutarotase